MAIEIEEGSENIFADLGCDNPDLELMRASLTVEILQILNERKLSVQKAGELAGVSATDISRVRNADLDGLTVDWLAKVLIKLNPEIQMRLNFSYPTNVTAEEKLKDLCREIAIGDADIKAGRVTKYSSAGDLLRDISTED